MLTFVAVDRTTFRLKGGEKDLIVFPSDKGTPGAISLFSTPRENMQDIDVSWPGEYNEAGVSIRGIGHLDGQQVSYVIEQDGVRAAFLSAPLQDWTDAQIEMVGDVDVLVMPASEAKLTQKLVDEFDPRILILLPGAEGALGAISKTIGVKETVSEYKLKGALPAEGREVIALA
jgi:hypothetical protein